MTSAVCIKRRKVVKQLPKICALLGIALLLSTSFVWARPDCTQPYDDHGNFPDVTFTEFYQINEAAPHTNARQRERGSVFG
jgi:hypothetical protein